MSAKQWIGRGLAVGIAPPLAFVLATSTALAADPVAVTNTETVQAQLDSSGKVRGVRVYEQLSFAGKGHVKVANPVSTDSLRNLDGFGRLSVKNGMMDVDLDVDGEQRMRTVSDFDKAKLPIKVSVDYTLDGKKLRKPSDAVGKHGRLAAHYKVENTSAQPRTITLEDGYGKEVVEESEVVIPMVGQLSTVLPPEFSDVSSAEANKAGDGKGGTKLSFTVTLFPPVGAATAEFGWSAEVKDAVVPEAELTALPVSPLDSPTFKTAVSGYESGAEKGADLVEGGMTIDTNLLKLRDGANKLLSGLLQLNAGAKELNTGLAEEAAPGATKLSTGASDLRKGLGDLESGADLLRQKTGEAAAGAEKLNKGAGDLQKGTGKLDAGAQQLKAGVTKLDDGAGKLKTGTGDLNAGAGEVNSGAGRLKTGAGDLKKGTGDLSDGLTIAKGKAPALLGGLAQIKGGLDQVELGLTTMYGAVGQLPKQAEPLHAGIKQLKDGIGSTDDPLTLLGGLEQLKKQLAESGEGIDRMIAGVYRDTDSKDSAGAYQTIGCAVSVANALNAGKAAGSFDNPQDRFCYGAQWPILNAAGITAEPPASLVRKTLLQSLAAELVAGRAGLADPDNLTPDLGKPLPSNATLQLGLAYLKGRLTEHAVPGITRLQCGLSNTANPVCDPTKGGLVQGLSLVDLGVSQLVSTVVARVQGGIGTEMDTSVNKTLRGGVNDLQGGIGKIQDGGKTLAEGLVLLADGAGRLDSGAGTLEGGLGELKAGTNALADGTSLLDTKVGELAEGTGQLKTGAGDLAAGTKQLDVGVGVLAPGVRRLDNGLGLLSGGTGQLADGVGKAADGSQQLAAGAGELASGIGDAAEGSTKLADGLQTATDGAPALPDGMTRLSNEGAKKLTSSGAATALDFGRRSALLAASADRAKNEGMPFGAPEGAAGATAYSLKLAGDTGEGGRNFGQLVAALAAFALAIGATGLVRRRWTV